ncbi:MAG: hypothetical protein GY842_11150 [bacterium]|nr:hypothetical protein [bacterium]
METIRKQVLRHLAPLIGRKLSIARRAADMRGFHFGRVTVYEDGSGSGGEFALHVQCPWRIEGPDSIVTGEADLWEPANPDENIDWDTWNYEDNENLQDLRIRTLLGDSDPTTGSPFNNSDLLIVERVEADDLGGTTIVLSGGYRLVLFPSGSTGEDWRLFQPRSKAPHFVVGGGEVEDPTDEAD